jgi:transposase
LLRADQGEEGPGTVDEAIADLVGVSLSTVHRVRQQFVEEGLEASLYRKPARNRQYRKLDGVQEAHLVALACSSPPTGRVCWTIQLLADKLVELEIVESIGREAVRTTLKKRSSALAQRAMGVAARAKRRFCLRDGRRARSLPTALRSAAAGRVF